MAIISLETPSPLYVQHQAGWMKNTAVVSGGDSIKQANTTYLPKLSEAQSNGQYNRMLSLASFFSGTSRAVQAYLGVLTQASPILEVTPQLEEFLDNVDLRGNSLSAFLSEVTQEAIVTRHNAIMLDIPTPQQDFGNLLEATRFGIRPYWRHLRTLDIIDWDYDESRPDRPLTFVKFKETSTELKNPDNQDDFTRQTVVRHTVLQLVDGSYRKRVYRRDDRGLTLEFDEFPLFNGRTLDFIPLVFLQGQEEVKKPIISDLVDMNLAHYRMSALHNYALAQTATPFLTISGQVEETDLVLGPDAPLILPTNDSASQARAEWTEVAGTGVSGMASELTRIEMLMARLGASVLEPQLNQAETAQALSIKRADENSSLVDLQRDIQDGLTMLINMTSIALGGPLGNYIELSTDFTSQEVDPQVLTQLMNGVTADLVPMETLFKYLVDTNSVIEGLTFEEYQEKITVGQQFFDDLAPSDPVIPPVSGGSDGSE